MCHFGTILNTTRGRRHGYGSALFPLDGASASRIHAAWLFSLCLQWSPKDQGPCRCVLLFVTGFNASKHRAVDLMVKLQCLTQHLPAERSPKCPRCGVASSSSAFIINERDSVCSALCTDSLDSASSIPVLCYFNVQDSLLCTQKCHNRRISQMHSSGG